MVANMGKFICFFDESGIEDVALVGSKNASLGELSRELNPQGVLVPYGFATTAEAYRHVLDRSGAWARLHDVLDR